MRTNDTFTPQNFQPEFARRIKTIRVALGYRRAEDFAEVLGFSQQQMSNWERGKPLIKRWDSVKDRIATLATYLCNPLDFANELGKSAEAASPILYDGFANQEVVEEVCDWEVGAEEWDAKFLKLLWAYSKAPFRRSAIIDALGLLQMEWDVDEMAKREEATPTVRQVQQDIKVHGDDYVLQFEYSEQDLAVTEDSVDVATEGYIFVGYRVLFDTLEAGQITRSGPRMNRLREGVVKMSFPSQETFAWKQMEQVFFLMQDEEGAIDPEKAALAWSVITSVASDIASDKQNFRTRYLEKADRMAQVFSEARKRNPNAP